MKRTLFIFALIFSTVVANAQKRQTPEQRARLEAKGGIRDIKLGSPKSLYKDLYKVENYLECGEIMKRNNENLYIGKVKVDSIRYLYVNDTLEALYIDFSNSNNQKHLSEVLKKLYGTPLVEPYEHYGKDGSLLEPNYFQTTYIWYADSFTVTEIVGFVEPRISFQKNDLEKKCLKLPSK